ncbi:MAG: RNA-binding S4 domain-containing protein [Prevotellaceae bacterium]|nr:RNA-binding S4 domain-containing protein [Prevotellaceae bacterium]MDY3856187.1 RNA-binding S4 domain-containing protein [Bacteroidaceae bacterium]
MSDARIDKWLWAARIYKTRTLAADACKNGRVTIQGTRLKPSHIVKAGDVIDVRKSPITYTFRIKQPIQQRVGAKLVPEILENITRPDQYELLEMSRISGFVDRARGTGRPTKRDRRKMDEFTTPTYVDDPFPWEEDDEDDEE